MRLFVALEIPAGIRENLAAVIRELRTIAPEPKWVRPENLHITLKFIGETPPAKLDAIHAALAMVRSGQALALEFRGVGFFAKARRVLILWVGLEATANLQLLARDIDSGLQNLGVPGDTRDYSPHVTLARSENPGLLTKFRPFIDANAKRSFGSFEAREFQLIESKLKNSDSEYTTLQSFPFVAEA